MSRKILISFLGSHNCDPCIYTYEDYQSENIEFIQSAIVEKFCAGWQKPDCIYIFSPEESLTNQKRLEMEWNPAVSHEYITVPDGKTDKEIWEIFHLIYNIIQDDDEVLMDITHGRRTLPMLASSVLQYAKSLKNIHISKIFYGDFEEYYKNKGQRTKIIPILNLTAFSDIQDWAIAANDFIHLGSSKKLNKITHKHITPILKESQGQDETAQKVRELNKHIENLSLNIITSRGKQLIEGEDSSRILENLEHIKQHFIEPLNPILSKLKDSVTGIHNGVNSKENMLSAVEWCIDKLLIQEGYTLLQEGIISYFLIKYDDKNQRDFTSAYLNHRFHGDFNIQLFEEMDTGLIKELESHFETFNNIDEWSRLFSNITEIRNDINHGGMTNSAIHSAHFEIKLRELYERTKELLTLGTK